MQILNVKNIINSYNFKFNILDYRRNKFKYSIFKKITKCALPLFFKGGDIISIPGLANGVYEPEIKSLIEHFAANGYSDFFIDIGANIGLSSCQSGTSFKEVHMFEPNPNCLSILKINSKIALKKHPYFIHECGLGLKTEILKLWIPYDNWGGAFLKSDDNYYNDSLLASKDGFINISQDNYDILDVNIESAEEKLFKLFASLVENNLLRGVIKIDVEGYEKIIVDAIFKKIPTDIDAVVIFENWREDNDFSNWAAASLRNIQYYNLANNKAYLPFAPRWLNSICNYFRGGFNFFLKPISNIPLSGACVITIS